MPRDAPAELVEKGCGGVRIQLLPCGEVQQRDEGLRDFVPEQLELLQVVNPTAVEAHRLRPFVQLLEVSRARAEVAGQILELPECELRRSNDASPMARDQTRQSDEYQAVSELLALKLHGTVGERFPQVHQGGAAHPGECGLEFVLIVGPFDEGRQRLMVRVILVSRERVEGDDYRHRAFAWVQ